MIKYVNRSDKDENALFKIGQDPRNNACVNFYGRDWNLFANGYKEAGDIIAKNIMESTGTVDTLVYPMIFLYRQYIELRLKDIMIGCNQLLHDKNDEYKTGHKIDELWKECKMLLNSIQSGFGETGYIKRVDECISHFVSIDPDSISFRYPEGKNGNFLLKDISHINVRDFFETLEDTSSSLDAISTYLSETLTLIWENREMEYE